MSSANEIAEHRWSDWSWKALQYIPLVMIGYHLYLAATRDPGFFAIVWIIEAAWIGLYALAFLALRQRKPWGYWYLLGFVGTNLLWEIWISSLMLNQWRLLGYSLPIIVLVILVANHNRFRLSKWAALVGWMVVVVIASESALYGAQIFRHKTAGEVAHWHIINTGKVTSMQVGNLTWCGGNLIVGKFFHHSPAEVGMKEAMKEYGLGKLDISTGEMVVIDKGGASPACSRDGQWVSYKGGEGYVRYQIASGIKELLLKGTLYGFKYPMAPTGDKVVFYEGKNQPVTELPTQEPRWQIFRWPYREDTYWKGVWSPDGKTLLILNESHKSQRRDLAFYDPEGRIIAEVPSTPQISTIFDFAFSPDGGKIYAVTQHADQAVVFQGGNHIDCFDLHHPELGWRTLISVWGAIHHWTVGPNGMVVFNHLPIDQGAYNYIRGSHLALGGLWLYRPDLKVPVRLTGEADGSPTISPDGAIVAFTRHREVLPDAVMLLKRT